MEKEQSGKTLFRGELALVIAVLVNSFGVVLMLYSGAGISAISSVPYAFSLAFPALTLGTWTYLFQGTLIASLMIMRRKWVWPYLFSFVVGFAFSELLDVHELWIDVLPHTLPWRVVYFVVSYLLICFGIALSNRCGLPIVPTDLFPRELADITKVPYPRIKIGFDVTCLAITAGMTFFFLGRLALAPLPRRSPWARALAWWGTCWTSTFILKTTRPCAPLRTNSKICKEQRPAAQAHCLQRQAIILYYFILY